MIYKHYQDLGKSGVDIIRGNVRCLCIRCTGGTYSKNVVFVSDGDVRVLGDTTKVCLTSSDLCVSAITVVVIVQGAVVHHR